MPANELPAQSEKAINEVNLSTLDNDSVVGIEPVKIGKLKSKDVVLTPDFLLVTYDVFVNKLSSNSKSVKNEADVKNCGLLYPIKDIEADSGTFVVG